MKLHRFFVSNLELVEDVKVSNSRLLHQWNRVLRFRPDRELTLFSRSRQEVKYVIVTLDMTQARLRRVEEVEGKTSGRDVYLCFSLLKKDKNDWVLQKCTELGVSHFVPLLSERTEKKGFDAERARNITIEAAEQCGRADIPRIHEPISPQSAVDQLWGKITLFVAEQSSSHLPSTIPQSPHSIAVFIGPEGGWTNREKQLFEKKGVQALSLSDFTLRAETACVVAATKLLG